MTTKRGGRPRKQQVNTLAVQLRVAQALQEEAARLDPSSARSITEGCFDKQLAFMRDPRKKKAIFTPRRAGKSNTDGIWLLGQAIEYPGRKSLYIGLTGESAEKAMYAEIMKRQLDTCGIRHSFHGTKREIELENGSSIKLFGIDSSPRDQDRVLLAQKYHAVVVDEAQAFTQDLRVIEEKVSPALRDYSLSGGGYLVFSGTPGLFLGQHYWFQITKQLPDGTADPDRVPGWALHEWSVADNPYMRAEFAALCEELREQQGPDYQDDPAFRRQWLGQWILDPGARVYKYAASRNVLGNSAEDQAIRNELTHGVRRGADGRAWSYVVGCDLGWHDATAFVVVAFCSTIQTLFIVESRKMSQAVASEVGAQLLSLRQRYGVERMVLDTAGIGRQLAESLRDQYRLPLVAADKREKQNHVGEMNSDFLGGRIKLVTLEANVELAQEWDTLVIDRTAWERDGRWKEHERLDNHLADACLYAWRDSRHAFAQPVVDKPVPTTAEMAIDKVRRARRERELLDAGRTVTRREPRADQEAARRFVAQMRRGAGGYGISEGRARR